MENDLLTWAGGWWMQSTDLQSIRSASKPSEKRPVMDGRRSWQYGKIQKAIGLSRHKRTAIDVGTHIGWWSYWLVKSFKHVIAFEPVGIHYVLCQKNVTALNFALHNVGLAQSAGIATMAIEEENTHNAYCLPEGESSDMATEFVPLKTLDSYQPTNVDLIKIDVEGMERDVLLGGEGTIRRDKPLIILEQAGHEKRYSQERDAGAKLLESWGAQKMFEDTGDYFMGWENG